MTAYIGDVRLAHGVPTGSAVCGDRHGDHQRQRHAWLVSSAPRHAAGETQREPVFGRVGPPRRHVWHDHGLARPCGLGAPPGGVRPPPGPPYAVARRTRRRGGAVRVAAAPVGCERLRGAWRDMLVPWS